MKDLFEVRFETKVVVASERLPKGLTDPMAKVVESVLPVLERAIKDWITDEDKKKEGPEHEQARKE